MIKTHDKKNNMRAAALAMAAVLALALAGAPEAHASDLAAGNADLSVQSSEPSNPSVGDRWQRVDWTRLAGGNAFGTMQSIVRSGWDSSDAVVIATIDGYWDALAASALAGSLDAPVLFTGKDSLSDATASEIDRLGARSAAIVGGTAAVSQSVESQLSGKGLAVARYAGANAQETAVQIASGVRGRANTCVVATSDGYWDALSASPYAYASRAPIYLTDADGELAQSTLSAIRDAGFERAVIAGGTAVVSASTEEALSSLGIGSVTRLAGGNAYGTADALAAWGASQGMSWSRSGYATASGYWDALAGAALCGRNNAVLMLADDRNSGQAESRAGAAKAGMGQAYVFGGPAALGSEAFASLQEATTSTWVGATDATWQHVEWYDEFTQEPSPVNTATFDEIIAGIDETIYAYSLEGWLASNPKYGAQTATEKNWNRRNYDFWLQFKEDTLAHDYSKSYLYTGLDQSYAEILSHLFNGGYYNYYIDRDMPLTDAQPAHWE